MKKIIILAMLAVLAISVSAQSSSECFLEGEIYIGESLSDDIACKQALWDPNFDDYIEPPEGFPCIKSNEWIAAGLLDNNLNQLESVRERLSETDCNDQMTELECNRLSVIADGFAQKLEDFQVDCTSGNNGPGFSLSGEQYVKCKMLLADMMKELGESAKIMWYTPDAFWMVHVLEDLQENLGHILAIFDEAARESFDDGNLHVDCESFANGLNGPTGSAIVYSNSDASASNAIFALGLIGFMVLFIMLMLGRKH